MELSSERRVGRAQGRRSEGIAEPEVEKAIRVEGGTGKTY